MAILAQIPDKFDKSPSESHEVDTGQDKEKSPFMAGIKGL
jgi:hypothetical protein